MKIKLQTNTNSSALSYEHDTELAFNDVGHVLDYAKRAAQQWIGVPWFHSLLVWNMTDETRPYLLAEIVIEPAEPRITIPALTRLTDADVEDLCIGCGNDREHCECAHFDNERK